MALWLPGIGKASAVPPLRRRRGVLPGGCDHGGAAVSDPAATFENGQLRWRGNYRSREEMVRQARVFLLSASQGDWFRPFAHDFAEQCRRAVEAYDNSLQSRKTHDEPARRLAL